MLAAWAPLAVLLLAGAFLGCSNRSTTTVADLIPLSAAEHQRTLQESMANGRLLYVRTEQYKSEPSGDLPQNLATEIWLGTDADGTFHTAVTTLSFPDGPQTMDMLSVYGRQTLSEWLDQVWSTAAWAERSGAEHRGSGKIGQWDSEVYEWVTDSGVQRLEIVADAPLISRESDYTVDERGNLTLTGFNGAVDYALLPIGAEAPVVDGN